MLFCSCACYFFFVSVLLALRLPRLGKRELILVLFVLIFRFCFRPFSIAITSPGEERANLSAFRTYFSICACLGSGKGCGFGTPCTSLLRFLYDF